PAVPTGHRGTDRGRGDCAGEGIGTRFRFRRVRERLDGRDVRACPCCYETSLDRYTSNGDGSNDTMIMPGDEHFSRDLRSVRGATMAATESSVRISQLGDDELRRVVGPDPVRLGPSRYRIYMEDWHL